MLVGASANFPEHHFLPIQGLAQFQNKILAE
jgi:hypothetical protein